MNARTSLSIATFVSVLALSASLEMNVGKSTVSAPSYRADGTDPMPNPYGKGKGNLADPMVVADGTDPMPNPYPRPTGNFSQGVVVADGTDPMPNPYIKSGHTGLFA